MVTKRKSEYAKARGDVRRALARMVKALPMVARVNWRNIVMPWRMLPVPVALALIALVALAMVLDRGDEVIAALPSDVTIGGDTVAPGTHCEEDEVITYRVLMGGQGVGCVHVEYVIQEFIGECIIGNTEVHPRVTPNLATLHLLDPAFGSWCASVVDDMSDGVVALADMLVDVNALPGYPGHVAGSASTPTITPTVIPSDGMPTTAYAVPRSLPSTGSR